LGPVRHRSAKAQIHLTVMLEELWISAAFLYRGPGSLSQDFIDRVKYDYGFTFRAVGEHTPQSDILAKNWDAALPMPTISGQNDF